MDFEPTLSPRFMVYIRNYLMDSGVDPSPLLQECGITIGAEGEYDPPLPISKVAQLFEIAEQSTNDPYIGMHLAQRYHYESAGLMTLTMLAAPSVKEGHRNRLPRHPPGAGRYDCLDHPRHKGRGSRPRRPAARQCGQLRRQGPRGRTAQLRRADAEECAGPSRRRGWADRQGRGRLHRPG